MQGKAYQQDSDEVMRQFQTSLTGLRATDIPGLLEKYGRNELSESRQRSRLSILLEQFADIMILILIIAAGISFAVGEHTDALVILAIIIANAWMGYFQESRAEDSIRLLRKMAAPFALVVRDNVPARIKASELVPGDLILLEAGDIVPADGRLLEIHAFKTDEASLTGESHSIEKTKATIEIADLVPGDQVNMVFKGTIVSNGSAKAIVTATGMKTELGKIAGLMDVHRQATPLQKRLAVFSKQLAVMVLVICAVVFVIGLWRGEPAFQMFLTSLSLAVAALPEALPAVITIALARGANRMVRQKALIRKLPAVETLGSVTYICTDKTGTLTQNVMTVEHVMAAEDKEELLCQAMLLNNEVRQGLDHVLIGDSTETALVRYSLQKGYSREEARQQFPPVSKLPFDSLRMRMSTLHRHGSRWIVFVKGAPVKMAEVFTEADRHRLDQLLQLNRTWAAQGLRVLFFGYRIFDDDPGMLSHNDEQDLQFLGMAAMIDPPRQEVIEAIQQCKTAGISAVMITGDQALTAKAIAERLEIAGSEGPEVRTGAELEKLGEEEFLHQVKSIDVYARVSPEQKLRIVKALQRKGEFVAMTGDGVNDAPSLKQADIGVAMGITGTDVTKDASDIILLDDNFSTIVKAVREGRRIYANILKFIHYVLSCNLGEILTIFLAPLLGFITPLLPIQILWINLVTDGLPGIALVAEHAERDIMLQPPRPPKENLFAGGLLRNIIISALIITLASLGVLAWAENQGLDKTAQQTMVFTTLCFVQLANALSVRSNHSVFRSGFLSNALMLGTIFITVVLQLAIMYVPFLQTIFKTAPLDATAMGIILAATILSFVSIEAIKLVGNHRTRKIQSK